MKKNFIQRFFWRLQFKKVKYEQVPFEGRCTHCDGGADPEIECGLYGCPCAGDEQLKRRK